MLPVVPLVLIRRVGRSELPAKIDSVHTHYYLNYGACAY